MKKTKNHKTGDKSKTLSKSDGSVVNSIKSADFMECKKWLVGIDEVGRGPLAGPVTVGAVAFLIDGSVARTYANLREKLMGTSGELNGGVKKEYPIGVDSKKMKESDREFWYKVVQKLVNEVFLYACTSSASAEEIDKKGIAVCIKDLVNKNLKKISKISKQVEQVSSEESLSALRVSFEQLNVLLDGGLKTELPVGSQKTIIKGDEKELVISLASVYAKVNRDARMKKLSKNTKYSVYEFDVHKGYGTLKHRLALKKFGLSDEHRRSFCKNILNSK
ncbi:MAG: ribonuclease HII [Candidatus Pacebacteria bacterium]|nr:ribonuclease HII [Candidatus Paceibacterota bacterium]